MRDKLVFFQSYYNAVMSIPPGHDRETMVIAILQYMFESIEPQGLEFWQQGIFEACRKNIENSISDEENGKKGGRPKTKTPLFENENPPFEDEKPPFEKSKTTRLDKTRLDKTRLDETRLDKTKKADKRPFDEIEDPEIKAAALGFREMRKNQRKPMTPRAEELLLAKLYKMASDDFGNLIPSKAVELLDNSTTKGWLDIYPVKESKKSTNIFDEIANA